MPKTISKIFLYYLAIESLISECKRSWCLKIDTIIDIVLLNPRPFTSSVLLKDTNTVSIAKLLYLVKMFSFNYRFI